MSRAQTSASGRGRRGLKATLFVLALIVVSPAIGLCSLEKRLLRGELLFGFFAELGALVPGFLGRWLRGAYYFGTLERCSWETHVGFGSLFTHRGAQVGRHVSTGAYCVIGHAQIGDEVRIGSRVSLPSGRHQHLDAHGRLAPVTRFERVTIGARSWVGEGAIVMADVGSGCIVSAGAVVSRAVPDGQLVAGNPAQIVRAVDAAPGGEGS
ncbi:MAG TPA: acyltransferase [Steroidobacteraceae bacterium]|nr:acyltransferase [Steroidobacteraceae bacterium]